MGVYDKFSIPKVNQSGFVFGQDFNDAMSAIKDAMRFMSNMGAYVVHPDMRGGAFPTITAALGQAREVPDGAPIIVALCPGVRYEEDVTIDQRQFETHDLYLINSFEDYSDVNASQVWTGSLTLPEIHPWSTRNKMLNLFGVNLVDFRLNLHSGWEVNMRRLNMSNIFIDRWNHSEGCRLWVHDCVQQGSFGLRDRNGGVPASQTIFSHCAMTLSDNPPSFIMSGNYDTFFVQSYITAWLTRDGGIFNMRPFVGPSYTGILRIADTTFRLCTSAADVGLAENCGGAGVIYEGASTFQVVMGSPKHFNMGAFAGSEGMPYCRLKGVMPTNAPRGTKASDDTVDYRDKTWTGAAWV